RGHHRLPRPDDPCTQLVQQAQRLTGVLPRGLDGERGTSRWHAHDLGALAGVHHWSVRVADHVVWILTTDVGMSTEVSARPGRQRMTVDTAENRIARARRYGFTAHAVPPRRFSAKSGSHDDGPGHGMFL